MTNQKMVETVHFLSFGNFFSAHMFILLTHVFTSVEKYYVLFSQYEQKEEG